jgi:hypothetical protein
MMKSFNKGMGIHVFSLLKVDEMSHTKTNKNKPTEIESSNERKGEKKWKEVIVGKEREFK